VKISDTTLKQAEHHMTKLLASTPHAVAARYNRRVSRIMVRLSNGLELAFPPHLAEGLAGAKPPDLAVIDITPAGLGLHWPRLDADLYLPSLLEGIFGSPRWMAALRGETGALVQGQPKPAPARENGRKGGRPGKLARHSKL
jgi:Protein of unknown function (DUF2442)